MKKELWRNLLVFPAYYEGTSFEDITNAFKYCIQKYSLDIEVIGLNEALPNSLSSDCLDDKEFSLWQLHLISDLIKHVDSFTRILFLDFFFPGLDLLKYTFEKDKLKVKMGALLHGGAFLENDLLENITWLKYFELGYFDIFDKVYVPSKFLKSKCSLFTESKITITPWGIDGFVVPEYDRQLKFDIVFPHRLAKDKGIDDLEYIAQRLPELTFCITVPQPNADFIYPPYFEKLSKLKNIFFIYDQNSGNHLKTLSSSKLVLSCAKQENFGYAIHKCVHLGVIPILPAGVCYEDFFRPEFIYQNLDEAIGLIRKYNHNSNSIPLTNIYKLSNSLTFMNLIKDFFEY